MRHVTARAAATLAVLTLALGACSDGAAPTAPAGAASGADQAGAPADDGDDDAAANDRPTMREGKVTFTIGDEVLTDEVTCVLEPSVAAGQTISYYATAGGGFDVMVSPESAPRADVSWEDGEISWIGGSDVTATLDGTTIRGGGSFSKDGGLDQVPGEFVVTCDG